MSVHYKREASLMHRYFLLLTMLQGPFGLMVCAAIGILTQPRGLYEKRIGTRVSYARPMLQRLSMSLFAMATAWMAAGLRPFSLYWYTILVGLVVALSIAYLAGPNEVEICLGRRTYQAKCGWPMAPRIWSGRLEDVLYIWVAQNSRTFDYTIILCWKRRRQNIILGVFLKKEQAVEAAASVAHLLNVDVLSNPAKS